MEGLREHRTKRTVERMAEPAGNDLHETQGIFVVHNHGATHLPNAFRLKIKGSPTFWAVPKRPSMNPKDRLLAVRLEDHPMEYIAFSGGIPDEKKGTGIVEL